MFHNFLLRGQINVTYVKLCFKTPFKKIYSSIFILRNSSKRCVYFITEYANIFAFTTFYPRGQTNAIFLYVPRSVISQDISNTTYRNVFRDYIMTWMDGFESVSAFEWGFNFSCSMPTTATNSELTYSTFPNLGQRVRTSLHFCHWTLWNWVEQSMWCDVLWNHICIFYLCIYSVTQS